MYTYDPTLYRSIFESDFTLQHGFWRNVDRFGSHLALHDTADGRSWSYAELGDDIARMAAGLQERGVKPGDPVVFSLFNSAAFAQLLLACAHLGAIPTPINFRFSSGETAHVLDDSEPAAVVYDESLAPMVGEALRLAAHTPRVITSAAPADLDALFASAPIAPCKGRTAWDEAVRLYTSGTTGLPKGVSLSAAAQVFTAHDVIMHFPLDPSDRTLNMSPWFHRGGISPGGPSSIFYVGAASVVLQAFDAGRVLDLVTEHGLTYLIGTPTNLDVLAAAQETKPRDLTTLRGIVTMGAPLERAACLRYQEVLTPRIFNGYGTTEAFWNTFLRPSDLPDHAGTAGRACTDDDVRVVALLDDGSPADPDDVVAKDGTSAGEIIMRSLKSGYAYLNRPTEQEAKFRDGWLFSGDLGTWDADGFITIVGRKDDMIISGGENIHPVQIEEVLNEHPAVTDCIVVGVPDQRWGQLVVADVQLVDSDITAADLDRYCREHPMLADFKRPRAYRFVDELRRTATGKKMHYVVRDELAGQRTEELVRP
jgi:acyl-CoA synthetase (AMP-forming)/AMP-acid ligase II